MDTRSRVEHFPLLSLVVLKYKGASNTMSSYLFPVKFGLQDFLSRSPFPLVNDTLDPVYLRLPKQRQLILLVEQNNFAILDQGRSSNGSREDHTLLKLGEV